MLRLTEITISICNVSIIITLCIPKFLLLADTHVHAVACGSLFSELVPAAAATKPPPPVIFIPTRISHICSGGGDFGKLQ